MQKKALIKVVASVLCVLMVISAIPFASVSAMENWDTENVVYDKTTFGTKNYYNVISKKDYTLVPGAAVESEMVLNNSAGSRRQVMHIIEVDPSNPDVSVVPGYYGIDKDLTNVKNQKAAGVTETAAYYENNLGYNVVGGMNTALAYDSNAPYSYLVYNGQVLADANNDINNFHSGLAKSILCVYKNDDGTCYCELRTSDEGLRGDEWQAVSANFAMVVKDGKLVTKTVNRKSAAARSMIGVKENGTLVLVMNDGRNANNSVGFSPYEEGEAMLALGCKWAFNCDGGGSSSFITKRAGEDNFAMRCVPCDGAERPTIHSVFVVSNVAPTGELNNVNIKGNYDYFAPGSSFTFSAEAIDTHGYSMDMPADASWSLSDSSFGTIQNGTFTSNGTTGDVDIQMNSGGKVVGSKTIHVANPTTLELSAASTILSYSTAEKPRKINIPIVAKIGEANVYYDTNAFEITSSVEGAGTIDGFTFTATSDETVTGTVVTAKYLPTGQELVYTITYGKGSETLWDFEDGDVSNWYGGDQDVKKWLTENGVAEEDQLKTLISGGQISFSQQSHTFLSTKENGGQVHNGNNALGVNFDFRNVEFNGWVYAVLYNVQDQYVLRDVANGKLATSLGMWCYVPEGFCNPIDDTSGALAMQLTVYKNPEGTSGTQLNFQFYSENQQKMVSLNACTEADIPEDRWVYLKADLTGSDYYSLTAPKGTTYREPSFLRMYIKPTRAQELTYYFDEFTLDYSSAVDDRDAPLITNPTYCLSDTNIALNNPVIGSNTVSFDANIADFAASNSEGLDYSTAAIYVDGVKLDGVSASDNTMGVKNVVLSEGSHSIKFEISDKIGNFSYITRKLTVDTGSSKALVSLEGHNDKNNVPESGSIYYADLVASDIAQVDSATATLKLNTANAWELDHMIPAEGYTAEYSYNEISKLATVTVKKTGNCTLTGEQTLVSIPVRVWSFDENTTVGGDGATAVHYTTEERFNKYGEPKVYVDVEVVKGVAKLNDDSETSFLGNISVETKLLGDKSNGVWHQHTAEAVEDKAATCTEEGFTGRTYCEECGSVVDWGTVVPAKGHSYELVNGKFVCSDCGAEYELGTGIVQINGKTYYAIGGKLVTGWQQVDEDWYLFQNDYSAYVGDYKFTTGVTYHFNDDGKLSSGVWYYDGTGYKYYYGPDFYKCRAANPHANTFWVDINGDRYAFDRKGYRHNGISMVYESNNDPEMYEFTEDGKLIGKYESDYTGLFKEQYVTTYLKNGVPFAAGLIKEDGYYYYINSGYVAVSGNYVITRTNGLLQNGLYQFDQEGRMINPPQPDNGPKDDGFFYRDGVKLNAYQLVEYEGDYYFISDYHKYAKNVSLYLGSKFTDGTPFDPGVYSFDNDGKLIVKDGPQDDGYFYRDGVKLNAYQIVEYDGDFYFISDYHKYARNTTLYIGSQFTKGTGLDPGVYEFGDDGKIQILNGPQDDGYFYRNGVKLYAYQIAEYKGNYYFVSDYHKYAKNITLYLGEKFTNGTPLQPGVYEFDETGKIIIKNGPMDDGFFYRDGVRLNNYQLVEFEGNYYFISDYHKYAKNTTLYLGEQFTNGTPIAPGVYKFDDTGKIIIKNGPDADGYFYNYGVKLNAYQLVEFEGNYYFISDYHKYAKNITLYLGEKFVKDSPLEPGVYQFDETGKIVIKNGPQPDGTFYLNGVMQKAYQVVQYDGNYYFIYNGNKIAKNQYLYVNAEYLTGTYLREWYYNFDSEGKMMGIIDGIPNGRDIGDIDYIKTTDGKDIKSGVLIRGGEVDNAVYHYPEEYIALGIDSLKNTYKVKTDMDLREPSVVTRNVLGDGVQHKVYNMVYYDEIFTTAGKAKVKEVFTDLANPDNYPVYLHCTHGVDRTGTVACLLEAIIGVPQSYLNKEYMLSVGAYGKDVMKVVNGLKNNYPASNIQASANAYLLDCGMTQDQIDTLKSIYVEE